MRAHFLTVLFTSSLTLLGYTQTLAQGFCHVDCVERSEECLAKHHACGNYDIIIGDISSEDEITLIEHYFLGLALYSKYTMVRDAADRCDYQGQAKEQLSYFLISLRMEFSSKGNFGNTKLPYIRNATRLYKELDNNSGCLEKAPSEQGLKMAAALAAEQHMQDLFLEYHKADKGEGIKDKMETLSTTMQGIVSKSADIVSGLSLRKFELDLIKKLLKTSDAILKHDLSSENIDKTKKIVAQLEENSLIIKKAFEIAVQDATGKFSAVQDAMDKEVEKERKRSESIRGSFEQDFSGLSTTYDLIKNVADTSTHDFKAERAKEIFFKSYGSLNCYEDQFYPPWFCAGRTVGE